MIPTHRFKGYDIPIHLMQLTGGGPEWFDASAAMHIERLQRHVGLAPHHSVLEVGCGIGRDAIPLTDILSPAPGGGGYTGTDIVAESIAWCRANIQVRHPHFTFHHLDIRDPLYNPRGRLVNTRTALPPADASIDRVVAQSVFTHMLKPDVLHHMTEFRRVLRNDGLVFATVFLYDDDVLTAARASNLTVYNLRFEHQRGDGCRINVPEQPTAAVAYTRAALDSMVSLAGLRHAVPPLPGGWSGFHKETEDGQDTLILGLK